jgi:hypothetical protein
MITSVSLRRRIGRRTPAQISVPDPKWALRGVDDFAPTAFWPLPAREPPGSEAAARIGSNEPMNGWPGPLLALSFSALAPS